MDALWTRAQGRVRELLFKLGCLVARHILGWHPGMKRSRFNLKPSEFVQREGQRAGTQVLAEPYKASDQSVPSLGPPSSPHLCFREELTVVRWLVRRLADYPRGDVAHTIEQPQVGSSRPAHRAAEGPRSW